MEYKVVIMEVFTMVKKDAVEALRKLDVRVREASKDYFHSRPVANYMSGDGDNTYSVSMGLRSLMLVSAVTGNNVLLTGSTGSGKTHLSKMVMAGLFGNTGYKTLQIDANFSLDKLRDISFSTVASGGRLSEAVKETPLLTVPGVVIDEYNRAPPELTNIIQGWLQNGVLTFEGGREVNPGVVFNGRERYQWKVATVNEGSRYSGARKLDKASRDRLSVEIPLDVFPLTDDDRRNLSYKTSTSVDAFDGDGALEDLLKVAVGVREVPLTGPANEFIIYLQRMNQCVKTPNKTKLEVENFSPEYCKGCHLSKGNDNICGSVYAPSDRSVIALRNLSKGFALYRCLQTGSDPSNLKVELEEVVAAAPFVFLSKLDMHPGWIDRTSNGSRWQAVNNAVKVAYNRFKNYVQSNFEHLQQNTPDSLKAMQKYAQEKDAWCIELSRA